MKKSITFKPNACVAFSTFTQFVMFYNLSCFLGDMPFIFCLDGNIAANNFFICLSNEKQYLLVYTT